MLLVSTFAIGLILLPLLILRAVHHRQEYCGSSPNPCFWCRRRCTYYNLQPSRT